MDIFWDGFDFSNTNTPTTAPTTPTTPTKPKLGYDYWSKLADDLLSKGLQAAEIIAKMKGQGYQGSANFSNDAELQAYLAQQAQEEQRIQTQKYLMYGAGALALIGLIFYATR